MNNEDKHNLTRSGLPITDKKLNTPNTWARAIAETLEEHEVDVEAVFTSIGMDYSRLNDKDGYYLQDQITQLWNTAAEISQNPYFGLKAGIRVHSTSYPTVGYALMASKTFYESCQRMMRYQDILAEGFHLKLEKLEDFYALTFDIRSCELPPSVQAVDGMFSSFLSFIDWLTQKNVVPVKASLKRMTPKQTSMFDDIFCCPIEYESQENRLFFSDAHMKFPLATADEGIAAMHDAMANRLLEKRIKGDFSSNVRNLIIDQLPKGEPKQDKIAQLLDISSSTLKRRLQDEDTSFTSLLDETREQLACSFLQQPNQSLTHITEQLGFSEYSVFSRAFKRWTGMTPKQWQRK